MTVEELAEAQYRTYVGRRDTYPDWDHLPRWHQITLCERMAIALGLEGVEGAYTRLVHVAPAYASTDSDDWEASA